jgi:hypothetical protein
VSVEYNLYEFGSLTETHGSVSTEKSIRHGTVLEKSTCYGQVELTIGVASIYKEEDWKYGFAVCGSKTGRDEGKFRIGGDGILDSLKSEFPCNRDVVVTSPKAIAEFDKLYERSVSS